MPARRRPPSADGDESSDHAGAALLGWIAGELFVTDVGVVSYLGAETAHTYEKAAAVAGAVFVLAIGAWLRYGRRREAVADQSHS